MIHAAMWIVSCVIVCVAVVLGLLFAGYVLSVVLRSRAFWCAVFAVLVGCVGVLVLCGKGGPTYVQAGR